MSLHHLKKAMEYSLVFEFPQAGEGAWKHSQIQTGVETKATESQRQEG